jgi:hypothetical protein
MLEFVSRGRFIKGDFDRMVWRTTCDGYRVERTECKASKSLPYTACIHRKTRDTIPSMTSTSTTYGTKMVWSVLSRHRTKNAAVKACESHAKLL